jgi:peptidoglycan hydrolase-like protein with peptidoglycan-binding domain
MKRQILLTTIALVCFPLPFRGDDQVRSVQEELRRRNLYFGDVDGRRSGEFSEAVRRYQKRKGFNTSGIDDRETLRSMGLTARLPGEPAPKELEWPEEPVLKSDTPVTVTATAKAVSEETGVATAAFDVKKALPPPSEKEISRASANTRQISTQSSLPPIASRNNPGLVPANIAAFVKKYVRSLSAKELKEQLHFYGDRVNYYHSGVIDRRLVERSLHAYAQRWPSRQYSVGKVIDYTPLPGRGEIVLTFPLTFTLKGHGRKVTGRTENRVVINAATSDPRIISIEERRVKK